MVIFLRALFAALFVAMLAGTVRASLDQALFDIPSEVYQNPWFQVTLLDAYCAFLTFYVWVAWKEDTLAARVLWFVVIMLWGTFALATYMLVELFRIPAQGPLAAVFVTRRPGALGLPLGLAVVGVLVYLVGAQSVLFP